MKKLFLLLVTVLTIGMCASAQMRTINGVVIDADTEETLIDASVTPAGEAMGVSTDIDGKFTIQVPANVTHLTVSYVGYTPQTVAIVPGTMTIKLSAEVAVLDEVIAVAYGSAKRSEYTGSAGVVKADQIENALVSNVTSALTGNVSGVKTFSSSGQPGSAPTVQIRGTGSINAGSSPLYVVDGVPYPAGDISSLSTSDVESMVVLKDAASTALYGARGANGVILITTRRGKEGQARVSVDARWGVNTRAITSYDMIDDPRQFMETTYQAMYNTRTQIYGDSPVMANKYVNDNIWNVYGGYQTWTLPDGQQAFSMEGKFNPYATMGWSNGKYYFQPDSWEDESLIDGLRQEYTLSITGGTERLQYYISGTYLEDEGLIKGSHFNRLTTRASVDYQAKDWLKIGSSLSYIYADQGAPGEQSSSGSSANVFYFINSMAPVFPVYVRNADGSIMWNDLYNNPVYDYGDGADYGNGRMGVARTPQGNPTGMLLYNTSDYLMDILDAKWYAEISPLKGLTFTQNVAYYVDNTRTHHLYNGLYGQFANIGGQVSQGQSRMRTITLQSLLNYQININEVNDLYFLLGYESEDYASESVSATGSNLYQPLVPYVDNTIDNLIGGGSYGELNHKGFFFQGKYTYDGRYYVMGSFRRDASSRFAPGKKWGSFWSLSAGWDIAKEQFFQDFKSNLDLLKFKASFGQTGNDNVATYAWADIYQMTGADGVFSDGVLGQKGNKDLTWEKSNSFNTGFDFSFWKGKLSGTVEYFNRTIDDMLFYLPVAPSLGYTSLPSNVGSMRNYGFELDLNYQLIRTRDITWDIFMNVTHIKNEVLELDPSILNDEGAWQASTYQLYREGHSIYEAYLPVYAGVDPDTGYAQYLALDDEGMEYKTPDWSVARTTNSKYTDDLSADIYGGFGTRLSLYGVDFTATFSYQLGGELLDNGYAALMTDGASVQALHKDLLNATVPGTDKVTDVPMLITEGTYSYANSTSTRFLTSSDYLALNNITLGYTLPANFTRKLGLGNVRVYGSAENVAIWCARKGLDPRQGTMSSSNHTYSPVRAISGGIHVDF